MQKKELNKKQIIIVTLISLLLVVFAVGLDMILKAMPRSEGKLEGAATVSEASAPKENPSASLQYAEISSKLTEIVEDKPYEPSPDVLNLAYYYPEGADTSDVINSYAGRLYTELTAKEAQYMADIYDMSDRTPLSMAKQLGLPTSRVMGKYNPNDQSQSEGNPATWTVGSFKNANVAFYDGDGNRINAYSAVKEIMSLASVYSYYHDRYDYEAMRDYALKLWEHSHSYTISMGNVYYDSGCLNKTIEQEAEEAIAQEEQQLRLEESLAGRTAASSGGETVSYGTTAGPANDIPDETEAADEATLYFNPAETEGAAEASDMEATLPAASETAGNGSAGGASQTPASNGETSPAPASTVQPSTAASTKEPAAEAPSPAQTPAAAQPADEATFAAFSHAMGTAGLSYQGMQLAEAQEATLFGGGSKETAGSGAEASMETPSPSLTQAADGANGASQAVSAAENPTGESVSGGASGPGAVLPSAGETSEAGEEATLPDTGNRSGHSVVQSYCPGHIDLYITVTIYGIDDANGLMRFDTIGGSEDSFNDEWQGWTAEAAEMARKLNSEDWFKRYGLTLSAINVRNPLTESEIDDYLARIPDTISQARRDVVSFALHSVGKVPYYWGGKPSAPRYEENNYGTLVAPDTKGRVLRGLDCSGWVNWVYWSALGNRLAGESTGTLIGCGQRIARADLQPGDIIVRTGADAHVVMFLEWAGNGNMIVVHETGGITNNVTVSEMTANWPYYRKLVE